MSVKVFTATGTGQFVGEAFDAETLRSLAHEAAQKGNTDRVHITGQFDDIGWVVSDVALNAIDKYLDSIQHHC